MIPAPFNRRQFLSGSALLASAYLLPQNLFAASQFQLQTEINQLISQKRRLGLLEKDERVAFSIYDFKTRQKLVRINETLSLQAASMIKPFVAVAYFYLHSQNRRKYPYNLREQNWMHAMLVNSSNSATTALMKLCAGPANVKRLAQLAAQVQFVQLSLLEMVPQNGKTYRNKASAHDYSKLLYAIHMGKVPSAAEIRLIMSIANADRIVSKTNLPAYLNVYDKTGSTARCCGDMGVVEVSRAQKNAYTFIGIIDKSRRATNYPQWIRSRGDVIREVSELSYRFLSRHYQLVDHLG